MKSEKAPLQEKVHAEQQKKQAHKSQLIQSHQDTLNIKKVYQKSYSSSIYQLLEHECDPQTELKWKEKK